MPMLVVGVVVQTLVQFRRSGEEQREEKAGERRSDDGGAEPSRGNKPLERPLAMAASMRGAGWSARSHDSKVNPLSM